MKNMGQPVKLSDELVLKARVAGEASQRSIAGQVEYWARLGKSIDALLEGGKTMALVQSDPVPLSECLREVGTKVGRERLRQYLNSQPYPHFEPHPQRSGLLIRIEDDGTRTTGRFVNREFVPVRLRKSA